MYGIPSYKREWLVGLQRLNSLEPYPMQVVDHVSIPVIASGGIMDGRGIIASLALVSIRNDPLAFDLFSRHCTGRDFTFR
jgi:hypothetical protein